MQPGLRAGIARTAITPPLGITQGGWGAQTHQRTAGVDFPFYATGLALSDGNEIVSLLDLDQGYLYEPQATSATWRAEPRCA
jgi:hypothetical protein